VPVEVRMAVFLFAAFAAFAAFAQQFRPRLGKSARSSRGHQHQQQQPGHISAMILRQTIVRHGKICPCSHAAHILTATHRPNRHLPVDQARTEQSLPLLRNRLQHQQPTAPSVRTRSPAHPLNPRPPRRALVAPRRHRP